ncbi:MAG: hypothetical protein M1840_002462 [Geoglossum simile]|nr:MAG: hypothetical protein M1840_002462 [Geoglossum simile]
MLWRHLKSQQLPNERPPDEVSLSSHENNSNVSLNHVPGELNISLTPTAVFAFLTEELATPLLDELYTKLWLVARKSGWSIDPLHKQKIKEREIIVTEEARLHLVGHHNRIYIKPIPLSLLYHDFWTTYLSSGGNASSSSEASGFEFDPLSPLFDRSVALGFMRSYAFLVRHHSDYILARDTYLIPAKVDWARWPRFITHFHNIDDEEVARHYHYGQLRLSRLNWAVRLFRPRSAITMWFYEISHWSISMYMEDLHISD